MKLFLASSADKTLSSLGTLVPNIGKKVLFVANAADPYVGTDTFWINWDRGKFAELGYKLTEVDLRETTPEQFEKLLQAHDILHICGGSVYYLINLLRTKNLEMALVKAVRDETIVYTGTSAGAIIPSESIRAFSYDDEEREHVAKVPDHRGLGLIPFGIMPHSNNADFGDEHKKIVDHMSDDPTALFFIHDHQAIWVNGDTIKFLEANHTS
jgi:peptidase E